MINVKGGYAEGMPWKQCVHQGGPEANDAGAGNPPEKPSFANGYFFREKADFAASCLAVFPLLFSASRWLRSHSIFLHLIAGFLRRHRA